MALTAVPPFVISSINTLLSAAAGGTTLNAANETLAVIGRVRFRGGPAGTKTLSSSGGKIYFPLITGLVWVNAATNLRVGLQDVDVTTGLEDGTFDVQADLVPGTETLVVSQINSATMESGTKTVSDGDLLAVAFYMTARAGADSVQFGTISQGMLGTNSFPYGTRNIGGGLSKLSTNGVTPVILKFDDGTFGWIEPVPLTHFFNPSSFSFPTFTFNSGSATDEYAGVFRVPFKCQINAIGALVGEIDTGEDPEIILYSDPLGTPVAERTVVIDADVTAEAAAVARTLILPITPFTLEANTDYAVAVRATSANDIVVGYSDLTSGMEDVKQGSMLASLVQAGRANQTGAFAQTQAYHMPILYLGISQLDDGSGGGGGGGLRLAGHGGLAA